MGKILGNNNEKFLLHLLCYFILGNLEGRWFLVNLRLHEGGSGGELPSKRLQISYFSLNLVNLSGRYCFTLLWQQITFFLYICRDFWESKIYKRTEMCGNRKIHNSKKISRSMGKSEDQ